MRKILLFCLLLSSTILFAQAPTVAAPTPTQDETTDNVLSIYSGAYTDVTGTDFNPGWGQSTVQTFETIAGDETNKYANLNYQGTQFAAAQDVAGHEFLHVDFWTDNSSALNFFLISETSGEIAYALPITTGEWVSVDIPLTAFAGLDLTDIHQFKVDGNGTIWFDNWYFHGEVAPPPPPAMPAVAAPTPTQDETNDNVLSIYSGAYTDLAGTGFNPNWGQGTAQSFETIAGDETNKYANLNYQGTQFAAAQDVSGHEFFHVDFWTADATLLEFFLISQTTGEQKVDLTITANQWVSVDIELSDYTNQGLGIADIHQFKVVGNGTIWFDNWFFHGEVTPPPPPVTVDITFCVDLSCYSSITAPTVFGAFNGWNAGANAITDPDGDGTYCGIVAMMPGDQEYKFFFQEEGPEDMATPEDDACTLTTGAFTNRIITVVDGMPQTVTYGWETCDAECEAPPAGTDITFCVDLSCFSSVTAPTIYGAFNGWNAGANPITDTDGDGTYCATVEMEAGSQEYKFFFQQEGPEDMATPEDDACTMTTGANTNRLIEVVEGVTQTVSFGWETCDAECTEEEPLPEPAVDATDPSMPATDVISMFSNTYTNTGVDTWLTAWSNATLEDIQINGNDTKLYTNLVFFGAETTGANIIDASTMESFNLDFWTPDMNLLKIKLVDFGADGVFGGGDDSEGELIFNDPLQEQWVTYNLLLSDFEAAGLLSTQNIAQLIISADAPNIIGGSSGSSSMLMGSNQTTLKKNGLSSENNILGGTSLETNTSSFEGSMAPATLYLDNIFFSKPSSLPVILTSFSAKAMEGRTMLEWSTESEINNDYFQIERSNNGTTFESLEKVKGAVNSTKANNYSTWDNSPSMGINYYRLKQMDLDGSFEYSDVITTHFDAQKVFRLVNKFVVGDNVEMAFNIVEADSYNLITLDATGRTICNKTVQLSEGYNEISFNTPTNGILITMLTNGSYSIVEKVFK